MIDPDSTTYRLLYCNQEGELVGLDEVQYLDPYPAERVQPLRALLTGDPFVRYQASLVLAAWADPVGLDAIAAEIEAEVVHEHKLAPHRISDVDTVYDEYARALWVGLAEEGTPEQETIGSLALALLAIYEHHYFRTGMRLLAEWLNRPDEVSHIAAALQRAVANHQIAKASELLPAVAMNDPAQAWRLLNLFRTDSGVLPEAQANVCDALAHIRTPESRDLVTSLADSDVPGVRQAASEALQKLL